MLWLEVLVGDPVAGWLLDFCREYAVNSVLLSPPDTTGYILSHRIAGELCRSRRRSPTAERIVGENIGKINGVPSFRLRSPLTHHARSGPANREDLPSPFSIGRQKDYDARVKSSGSGQYRFPDMDPHAQIRSQESLQGQEPHLSRLQGSPYLDEFFDCTGRNKGREAQRIVRIRTSAGVNRPQAKRHPCPRPLNLPACELTPAGKRAR